MSVAGHETLSKQRLLCHGSHSIMRQCLANQCDTRWAGAACQPLAPPYKLISGILQHTKCFERDGGGHPAANGISHLILGVDFIPCGTHD